MRPFVKNIIGIDFIRSFKACPTTWDHQAIKQAFFLNYYYSSDKTEEDKNDEEEKREEMAEDKRERAKKLIKPAVQYF